MVCTVWPKSKRRIEQIGLELSLDNEQQAQLSSLNVSSLASEPSSHLSNVVANSSLGTTATTRSTNTCDTFGSTTDINNQSHPSLSGHDADRSSSRSPVSIPRAFTNFFSPHSPGTMSIRINSEFKKNMFYVSQDSSPITTNLSPEDVFEELGTLGSGSSGMVLKMLHKPTGKICAVKKMRRTFNEEENKRIYMDLQVVLQCDCDNIVKCYGYFIRESEVWICMELMTYCFDKLLKLRKKPLPERCIGAVAASAVRALYYLKETHHVIHRDVKPSNILVNELGQIKLCDFGISGRLKDSMAKTRAAGCLPYMAPERIDFKNQTYDIRSDVWSLGISLYELATGRLPYSKTLTEFDLILKVINHDPPALPEDMDFTQEFRDFISVCLTKDPDNRPKYAELKEHEFIKRYRDTVISLSELET